MTLFGLQLVDGQTLDNRFQLIVCQNGTGDYSNIQDAIAQVRDYAEYPVEIIIKAGEYHEKVTIPNYKRNIILRGEEKNKTIISCNDYSGKERSSPDIIGNQHFNTYNSYTLLIAGDDCTIENLTIKNTAGRVGQAIALHTDGDRIIVNNCNILSNQDSFFLNGEGNRIFVKNCNIEGTTDFIFGNATAFFTACTITSLSNSYITAASTTQNSPYGFIFDHCEIIPKDNTVNKVYLGRPWRPYAKTIFMNCHLHEHIIPEGWNPWIGDKNFPNKELTSYYAEYKNYGKGAQPYEKRANWSKQLSNKEAKKLTLKNIFGNWNPLLNIN